MSLLIKFPVQAKCSRGYITAFFFLPHCWQQQYGLLERCELYFASISGWPNGEKKRVEGEQGNWERKSNAVAINPSFSLCNSYALPAFLLHPSTDLGSLWPDASHLSSLTQSWWKEVAEVISLFIPGELSWETKATSPTGLEPARQLFPSRLCRALFSHAVGSLSHNVAFSGSVSKESNVKLWDRCLARGCQTSILCIIFCKQFNRNNCGGERLGHVL